MSAIRKAINAYAQVGVETGVAAADPHKLIMMLFEGALYAVADARGHMANREIAAKGRSISKAIDIIDGGLRASLDMKVGGELPFRLAGLYEYMCKRLIEANARNDEKALDEVSRLLRELGDAWGSIGAKQRAAAPSAGR